MGSKGKEFPFREGGDELYPLQLLLLSSRLGHVYMVFRADLMEREGEAASMFSGTKTLAHIPSDIDDLKDKKGHVAED